MWESQSNDNSEASNMRLVTLPDLEFKSHSNKLHQSFAVVSLFLTTSIEFIIVLLFHRIGIDHIAMGPSALVFSIIYQYSRIVPAVYTYKIFGVSLNNKSFNYLLALQVHYAEHNLSKLKLTMKHIIHS